MRKLILALPPSVLIGTVLVFGWMKINMISSEPSTMDIVKGAHGTMPVIEERIWEDLPFYEADFFSYTETATAAAADFSVDEDGDVVMEEADPTSSFEFEINSPVGGTKYRPARVSIGAGDAYWATFFGQELTRKAADIRRPGSTFSPGTLKFHLGTILEEDTPATAAAAAAATADAGDFSVDDDGDVVMEEADPASSFEFEIHSPVGGTKYRPARVSIGAGDAYWATFFGQELTRKAADIRRPGSTFSPGTLKFHLGTILEEDTPATAAAATAATADAGDFSVDDDGDVVMEEADPASSFEFEIHSPVGGTKYRPARVSIGAGDAYWATFFGQELTRKAADIRRPGSTFSRPLELQLPTILEEDIIVLYGTEWDFLLEEWEDDEIFGADGDGEDAEIFRADDDGEDTEILGACHDDLEDVAVVGFEPMMAENVEVAACSSVAPTAPTIRRSARLAGNCISGAATGSIMVEAGLVAGVKNSTGSVFVAGRRRSARLLAL